MRISSVVMLTFGILTTTVAQETDPPKTLIGFLQPGMHLGIRSVDENDIVDIVIYSDSEFAIALDARVLKLDQLASKYPAVAQSRDAKLKECVASLDPERLGDDVEYDPWIGLIVDRRMLLCTATHVGDDYILVECGRDETKRRVFASRFISTIRWDDELRFKTSVGIVPKKADRTKR